MMYEDRHPDTGKPIHYVVCTLCGLVHDKVHTSGFAAAQQAIDAGWACFDGWFACPKCKPGDWKYISPVPEDYERPPDGQKITYRCQKCSTVSATEKHEGDTCRKCGILLFT